MSADPFDLTGRVAIVTGSGRGLGKAMALALGARGAAVVTCARTGEEAQAAAQEIVAGGGQAASTTVDVTDRSSCEALIAFALERFGGLHVLVNNAGTDFIQPASSYRVEDWDAILEVNLSGYFHCAQLAAQHMLEHDGGSIIMNSSIASSVGVHGLLGYGATKGAVNQLVRTMAVEWAQSGVRVNAIAPGYFDNIMSNAGEEHARGEKQQQVKTFTPMGRRGTPEELAGPVVFLASDASSYVTGHILYVDGGYTAM